MFASKKITVILHADGMMCRHCAARVKTAVEKTRGASAEIDLDAKTVTVTCPAGTDAAALAAAVTEAGYPARVIS